MTSLLLGIIYLAFISLGLPDSLLGSAWPTMYQELGANVSWAGAVSMIIAGGTIVSSLASDRMTSRLGAGKVTAVSVCITAAALFGFSVSGSFWMLCLWAVPYGLGAGGVDAALNNYVALHYPARHMSWLHCMRGVGASVGPMIMGQAISGGLGWNGGYRIISILQIVLTAVLFLSLPLWNRKTGWEIGDFLSENKKEGERIRLPQILKFRGVKEVLICFCCYCAVEATAGMWAASYCTLHRGIPAEEAAGLASLFYLGITAGRFVSGFVTLKVNDRNMIRLGQVIGAAGILLVALPLGEASLYPGLVLIGCGCAPIYPSIIHETPANFGADKSQAIIGVQMAFAYVGSCLAPPVFGLLAQYVSIALYPYYMLIILVLMVVMSERLHYLTVDSRKK